MPIEDLDGRRGRGFTLVELLVTVTVIGTMIALLLPAISQSKERARTLACSANQHGAFVLLAIYAADWRTYPTPDGQPGFDRSFFPSNKSNPDHWNAPPGYVNSVTETYMFGVGAWWVGAITQDRRWYTRKELQCTGVSRPGYYWQGRDQSWMNGVSGRGYLCSQIGNDFSADSVFAGAARSSWFVYLHPLVTSQYIIYDWWDASHAGNDLKTLAFPSGDPASKSWVRYPLNSLGGLAASYGGPQVDEGGRRAMMTCPVLNVPPGAVRTLYEPHGQQSYTGTQNGRAAADPEDKNYLFTDGSVVYVSH